jgi:stearoyl-CoA desaturase (delta-9 desaturase)
MGWMLREYHAQRYHDYQNVKDLQRDPVVMWQHRHYWQLAWLTNLLLILVIGLVHGDMLGTLLLAGFVRLVLSQHFTFFINSLAHMWGSQPYSDRNTAKDNGLIALLTYGEGYHNFHHRFASDYRNGIRWWQFDPTKWAIRLLAATGLARNLKRYTDERIERARAAMQFDRARSRVERLPGREQVVRRLQTEYELLVGRMHACYEAKRALFESRRKALPRPDVKELSRRYRELKGMWREQRRQWKFVLSQALELAKPNRTVARGT